MISPTDPRAALTGFRAEQWRHVRQDHSNNGHCDLPWHQDEHREQNDVSFGMPVEVYSRSEGCWLVGRVVDPVVPGMITAEFMLRGQRHRKTLDPCAAHLKPLSVAPPDLEEIDPAAMIRGRTDADDSDRTKRRSVATEVLPLPNDAGAMRAALDLLSAHVEIKLGEGAFCPVPQSLHHRPVRNNAFSFERLPSQAKIRYTGPQEEDVLVKIYLLDGEASQDAYDKYEFHDYIHGMMKHHTVEVPEGYYLGLVIHKDLNKNWFWKLKDEIPEKYNNFVTRSTEGGYEARGDPEAKSCAAEADYLISFTTGNKAENDAMLQSFAEEDPHGPHGHGPITFCSDRSLGFGGHFDAPAGLYLAKHGFGQPTKPGAWFEEYQRAATTTKCGVLILNFTKEYLGSQACRMELGRIPQTLLNVYIKARKHIVRWEDLKQNKELVLEALRSYDAEGSLSTRSACALVEQLAGEADQTLHDAHASLPFYGLALHMTVDAEDGDTPSVAWALRDLGVAHGWIGDHHEKREMLQRALEIIEKHFGPKHFRVANMLNDLAEAHGDLGDQHAKREMLQRALKIEEKHFGREHFEVAITLNNLANAHGDLGDQHTKVAITLDNLATVHGALEVEHAKRGMLQRALEMKEKHYGPEHFQVAIMLDNLANAHGALGDQHAKREMLQRSLRIQEEHYGPKHSEVAITLSNLADAHGALGDRLTQQGMLQRALEIEEKHHSSGHAHGLSAPPRPATDRRAAPRCTSAVVVVEVLEWTYVLRNQGEADEAVARLGQP